MNDFRGLEPILNTFCSHLCLLGRDDGSGKHQAVRTWLEFRRETLLKNAPSSDDVTSLFGYQLQEVIFDFMSKFLDRSITIQQSPTLLYKPNLYHTDDYSNDEEESSYVEASDTEEPLDDLSKTIEEGDPDADQGKEDASDDDKEELEEDLESDLLSRHLISDDSSSTLALQPM